jgi:hypothetical protein
MLYEIIERAGIVPKNVRNFGAKDFNFNENTFGKAHIDRGTFPYVKTRYVIF